MYIYIYMHIYSIGTYIYIYVYIYIYIYIYMGPTLPYLIGVKRLLACVRLRSKHLHFPYT